jgi:uncharacterized protein YcfJ
MTDKKEILSKTSEILKAIVSTIYQTQDESFIQNILLAKGVGLSTTAGAFGLASLGTASTGTAIGTLSGGALTNASLAWIGGSIFTGTIVVIGGAVASGYIATKLYNGKMRQGDIQDNEKEIISTCLYLVKMLEDENKLNNFITTDKLNSLTKALYPLLIQIYIHTDNISSNLNAKYKIRWCTNRMKLVENLDVIRDTIKK